MDFFNGLSTEAKNLIAVLGSSNHRKDYWKLKLEITHQLKNFDYTQLECIELPSVYHSQHNASLMHHQLSGLSFDDIRTIAKDSPGVNLGEIKSFFVRWVCGER